MFDGKSLPAGQASFTHFTEKEGLSNNTIGSILEDKSLLHGGIWISTESGLNKLVVVDAVGAIQSQKGFESKKVTFKIIRFEKNDGLKSKDFYTNSVCLDRQNRIWWGGGKSLTMLDMNKFSPSTNPPAVYLKQLDINDRFIDYRNLTDSIGNEIAFNGVQRFENYPLNLELPYDKNHLTFHFAAIDWHAPHKIQYSYVLEGLNAHWSMPSADPSADYRNLPYGNFTFQIRAIGESGQWSEPFEYTFIIHPPWWHTWWARTLCILSALMLIRALIKWRTAQLKQRQKELESEVDMATKEIREQKEEVEKQRDEVSKEKDRSDNLLLNILPEEIAQELKIYGKAEARDFDLASILFTDFKNFTQASAKMSAGDLVSEINFYFKAFDGIMGKHGIEKIKTIGDSYMAAGGLPVPSDVSTKNTVLAALEMQSFISLCKAKKDAKGEHAFEMRVGIHTGPVVAGIVGVKKFQYDIWGDTVNTASRMESAGEVGKVNVSQATYELLKDDSDFTFESRGKIEAKGKGKIEMWFVSKV
jgi:class 3 adenylate cyclase